MADGWEEFFYSFDDSREFEGFTASDIDDNVTQDFGSDISISDISESESEDSDFELNRDWTVDTPFF